MLEEPKRLLATDEPTWVKQHGKAAFDPKRSFVCPVNVDLNLVSNCVLTLRLLPTILPCDLDICDSCQPPNAVAPRDI